MDEKGRPLSPCHGGQLVKEDGLWLEEMQIEWFVRGCKLLLQLGPRLSPGAIVRSNIEDDTTSASRCSP